MLDHLLAVVGEYVPINGLRITEETSLRMDLGLNSLDLVNLAVSVENEFHVEISDRTLSMMKTVGDMLRLIESQKNTI